MKSSPGTLVGGVGGVFGVLPVAHGACSLESWKVPGRLATLATPLMLPPPLVDS